MIVRSLIFASAWVLIASSALAQEPLRPANSEDGPSAIAAPAATAPAATAPAAAAPAVTAPAAAPVAAPATAPAAVTRSVVVDAGDFKIGAEDVLDIQVWKNPDLSRVVPVRPDGRISLPLVNDIIAAGLTPTELRAQITERLAPFVPAAEVSVIVREVHSFKVSIVGAVAMSGTYEVKSAATVLDIIARAQGLGPFADRNKIVVQRKNGTATTQIPFNYSRVAEGKDPNFAVQPGDVIIVP